MQKYFPNANCIPYWEIILKKNILMIVSILSTYIHFIKIAKLPNPWVILNQNDAGFKNVLWLQITIFLEKKTQIIIAFTAGFKIIH